MAYIVRLIDCTDSISSDDQTAISGQLNTWMSAADSTRPTDKRLGVNVGWVTSLDSPTTARLVVYFVTDRGQLFTRAIKAGEKRRRRYPHRAQFPHDPLAVPEWKVDHSKVCAILRFL